MSKQGRNKNGRVGVSDRVGAVSDPGSVPLIRPGRIEPTMPPGRLTLHPQADLVPAMSVEEYRVLVSDVRDRGVVDPIEITDKLVVLDGRHRLRAAAELGLPEVPVRVVSPENEAGHIVRAALLRRHLDASQRAALAVELAEIEQTAADAKARKLANLKGAAADVATLPHRGERTREIAAEIAGVSARTVQDAKAVRDADPDLFQQVEDGEIPVHKAARRVRRARRYAEIPAAPAMPDGPFELIYADPPWQLGNPNSAYAPENHYPTMTLDEIKGLWVPAADDAILYLWAVSSLLEEAFEVIKARGFQYKSHLVWDKGSIGLGVWARNQHEVLLIARRGSFPPADPQHRPESVIRAPRGRHSEKPTAFYELIECAHPHASKLELFARGVPRTDWAAWGNEVIAA